MEHFTQPVVFIKAATFEKYPGRRFAACEPEIASSQSRNSPKVAAAVRKWGGSIVSDGSLPSGGYEINTGPANGDELYNQLTEISKALVAAESRVGRSCGCHTHIDVRDYTLQDLVKMVLTAGALEAGTFQLVPAHRQANSYCRRFATGWATELAGKAAPDAADIILCKLSGRYHSMEQAGHYYGGNKAKGRENIIMSLKGSKWGNCRYNWLNLHSYFFRGSIENRLPSGTILSYKMLSWAHLTTSLIEFAHKSSEEEILDLYQVKGDSPAEKLKNYAALKPADQIAASLESLKYVAPGLDRFINTRVNTYGNAAAKDYIRAARVKSKGTNAAKAVRVKVVKVKE